MSVRWSTGWFGLFEYIVRTAEERSECGLVRGYNGAFRQEFIDIAGVYIKGIFEDVLILSNRKRPGNYYILRDGVEWGRVCCIEYGGCRVYPPSRYGRVWTVNFDGINYGRIELDKSLISHELMWYFGGDTSAINTGTSGTFGVVKDALWLEPCPSGVPWDVSVIVAMLYRCMLFRDDVQSAD